MNTENREFLTLKDFWEIFVDNIWIFVISVVACISLSIGYIIIAPPVYYRSGSILIKSEDQGNSLVSQAMGSLGDLGMFSSNVNVYNELKQVETTSNLEDVIKRLGLQYNYAHKESGLRWIDLYNSTPFKLNLDGDLQNLNIRFKLKFKNASEFVITRLVIDRDVVAKRINGTVGQDIETDYGSFNITLTPLFDASSSMIELYRVDHSSLYQCVKDCRERLSVDLNSKENSVIDITLFDRNPQRAENFINTLISVYNEKWILDKNDLVLSTSHFIDDRIDIIRDELGEVDDNISDYKSDALMPDYIAVTGLSLERTQITRDNILKLNNQLSMVQYIQAHLKNTASVNQLLPANTGIENSSIEGLIEKYNEMLMQKNVLASNSSDRNPVVAELISNINSMREVINSSINDYVNTLIIQIENAKQEDRENKAELENNPKQAKELLSKERQQMVKHNLYLYLLQKREENELNQTLSAYNTKILNFAEGDPEPVAPRKIVVLFLGLVLGLFIPILYLIVNMSLDTTVKSRKDIASLNIPIVGTIPNISKGKIKQLLNRQKGGVSGDNKVLVSMDSRNIVNESFRVLRTNLDFMLPQNSGCNVLQTISLTQASGKSFVSVNLAMSISLKRDVKVLLVDADMRACALSRYIDSPSVGLSNYLSGKIENVEDVIVKGKLADNVDMIPVGTIPPNPSELLLSSRFSQMVEKLKSEYDYIFFDCPPVEIVSDSAIVGKYCSNSLFVIRANHFDKRHLSEVEDFKDSGRFGNMSLILNGVKQSARGGYVSLYGYGNPKNA